MVTETIDRPARRIPVTVRIDTDQFDWLNAEATAMRTDKSDVVRLFLAIGRAAVQKDPGLIPKRIP